MLLDQTIDQLAKGLRQKQFSSVDLVNESLANIKSHDPTLNALITTLDSKTVLQAAETADQTLSPKSSPLHGLPFVLKDSYLTKDLTTTAASHLLTNYQPPYNATVYQRLLDNGAILVGKANMDAWGHGGTSENSDFGPVKNPWNPEHVSGGSSGGCAAAVSSRMAAFAIGEDTGGSIRNPASWCSLSGLKVTYGRVSRYGCIEYASSFDTVGPIAKSAHDCAQVLQAIAGPDLKDATSSPHQVDHYSQSIDSFPKRLVVGLPQEFLGPSVDPQIRVAIKQATLKLQDLGAAIETISMPSLDYALAVYYLIGPSETSSNLARYDGVRYGTGRHFNDENMRRIMTGTYALSAGYYDAYYRKAQKVRTLMIRDFAKAFKKCHAFVMPVTTTAATKLGEAIKDPLQNMLIDIFTTPQNIVGVPSLAIPCGFNSDRLPFGFQLVGPMFSESLLFQLAHAYQQTTNYHLKKPFILNS